MNCSRSIAITSRSNTSNLQAIHSALTITQFAILICELDIFLRGKINTIFVKVVRVVVYGQKSSTRYQRVLHRAEKATERVREGTVQYETRNRKRIHKSSRWGVARVTWRARKQEVDISGYGYAKIPKDPICRDIFGNIFILNRPPPR